ncbi:MAG: HTH domain-containing protein [Candidatus Woesearchaeota archaeon]
MAKLDDSFMDNVEKSFKRVKEHFKMLESETRANRGYIIKQNSQILALLDKMGVILKDNKALRLRVRALERSSTGNEGVYSDIHSFTRHSLGIHSHPKTAKKDHFEPKTVTIVPETAINDNLAEKEPLASEKQPVVEAVEDKELASPLEGEMGVLPMSEAPVNWPAESKSNVSLVTLEDSIPDVEGRLRSPIRALSEGKREIAMRFGLLSRQELMTFLAVYQLEEDDGKVTYASIAKKLKLTEGCIRTYVSSLIKKGIPVVKKRVNNKLILLFVSPEFRDLGLKKELMQIYENSHSGVKLDMF